MNVSRQTHTIPAGPNPTSASPFTDQSQLPNFDTEKSTYALNYFYVFCGSASTFQAMTGTAEFTSALLLWRQDTPLTKLGDAFQGITPNAQEWNRSLSDLGLEGLTSIMREIFGHHIYSIGNCDPSISNSHSLLQGRHANFSYTD